MGQVGKCESRGLYLLYGKQFQNVFTIVTSSEVLYLCLSWFCLSDVAVGFICLIFKGKRTESTYDKLCRSLRGFSLQRHFLTVFRKELQQQTS